MKKLLCFLIIVGLGYFVYVNFFANTFMFNGVKLEIPEGLRYRQMSKDKIKIYGRKEWLAEVNFISKSEAKYSSIQELYEDATRVNQSEDIKLYTATIEGIDVFLYDFTKENRVAFAFFTEWDTCATMIVSHNKDRFDIYSIGDVIKSIAIPVK